MLLLATQPHGVFIFPPVSLMTPGESNSTTVPVDSCSRVYIAQYSSYLHRPADHSFVSEIAHHLDAAEQLLETATQALGPSPAERVAAVDLSIRSAVHLKQAYTLINNETAPRTVPCEGAGALPHETEALFKLRQKMDSFVDETYSRGYSIDDTGVADRATIATALDDIATYLDVGQRVYNDGDCIRNTRKVTQIKSDAGLSES